MGRLIEIGAGPLPRRLSLSTGDLLRLPASGARVVAGGGSLQVIGPLLPAVVGRDGRVLMPAAMPNVVFVHAVAPGSATLSLTIAKDLHSPTTVRLDVDIDAPPSP